MLWLRHEIKNKDDEQWALTGQIKLLSLFAETSATEHKNITIGRISSVDIQIDNIAVSRWHAILTVHRDAHDVMQLVVEDNRSDNGTWVNGQKISEPTTLKVGDSIDFFGKQRIVLVESREVAPPQAWNAGRAGETHKQTLMLYKKGI